MKALLVITFLLCTIALAENSPTRTWRAALTETTKIKSTAVLSHELFLLSRGQKVFGFDWLETVFPPPYCEKGVCSDFPSYTNTLRFVVTNRTRSNCGSIRFVARNGRSILEVWDHRWRTCDDESVGTWEASLVTSKQRRTFKGSPKAWAQECNDIPDESTCTTPDGPLFCKALEYQGEELDPIISVDAPSLCAFHIRMDLAACERGLDPKLFWETDILCEFYPPPPVIFPPGCPIAACIAPPEGCYLVPSEETDENGCPLNPCGDLFCPMYQ